MIKTRSLTFTYAGQQSIAFPDIDIISGEHTLLLGESGSGKTTLLHLVGGLLRNYEGSLSFNDTELKTFSEGDLDRFRGRNIGFIFQKNHLVSALSVEKNILLARYLGEMKPDKARLDNMLEELSIADKRRSNVSELSQGQSQRVAIGRALINHPPVILADEPTSALDDANCEKVIALLLSIATSNGATLIVATHDQRLKRKIQRQINLT